LISLIVSIDHILEDENIDQSRENEIQLHILIDLGTGK